METFMPLPINIENLLEQKQLKVHASITKQDGILSR